METKRCPRCGETKPREAFSRLSSAKSGLQSWCKACSIKYRGQRSEREKARTRERAREWYRSLTPEEREAYKARNKAHRKTHPEKQAEYQRRYRERHPEKWRARWVKSKYKLTQEQYEELLEHNGICDACRKLPATHIDHCHTTGRYRGQLCRGCNQAAGMLGDDPVRATALAAYLVRVTEETKG